MIRKYYFILVLLLVACGDEGGGGTTPPASAMPEINVSSLNITEQNATSNAQVEVSLSQATDVMVSVNLEAISNTAVAGEDFEATSTTVEIPAGQTKQTVPIPIIADGINEIDETFTLMLSNPQNGTIKFGEATVLIRDIDGPTYAEDGYSTPASIAGYNLVWSDEFDGDVLDQSSWTYEMGNGCNIGLCGWGNNELQIYTDSEENALVADGKLTITAKEESPYSSARIITQDKREFRFGRIDVRAKLPKGQGIWPAIWMLGSNISEVSWPACGEIDIMELVGHEPKKSHGTAHWGRSGEGSQFRGNSFSLNEDFSDRYHVFTLLWKNNSLQWYVDETLFHTITTDDTSGFSYPFNNEFFFIMNIAVGGNWPGEPDETTLFPQTMEVDYIRVFQE